MVSPLAHRHRDSSARHSSTRSGKIALAVALNCLLPGLGLAYLGKWWLAMANFLTVQLVVVGCLVVGEPTIVEHIHWVLMIVIVGSGALAHAVAKSPS